MTTPPPSRAAAAHAAGRAASDTAPPVPTPTAADPVTADPVTADHHVTAGEIVEFLRHLAELRAGSRGDDPGERAAFLARKAALFTRLAADTPPTTAAEGSTP